MLPRLLACLIAALTLSLGFAFSLPRNTPDLNLRYSGLNPDENDHVFYAQKIRETGGLVRFPATEIKAARAAGQPEGDDLRAYAETHQPPLYYIVGALLGGSLAALRVLSALIGLATVALAFRAAREILPEFPDASCGAAGLMACLPAAAQLSGAASNDTLTTLFCTGIFWRLGLLARRGITLKDALILAAWLGAGLWTKLTVLQLFPLVVIAGVLGSRATPMPPPPPITLEGYPGEPESGEGIAGQRLGFTALALTAALLIASPWLIRNQMLYGDPFNLSIFPLTAPIDSPTPTFMQNTVGFTPGKYLWMVSYRSLATFFYLLPPLGPLYPKTGPALFMAIFLLGGLIGGVKAAKGATPEARRVLWLCLAAPLVLLPFFIRFNMTYFQAQGRYFHPALFPVALGLSVGITVLGGANWGKRAVFGVCVVWFLLSGLQILTLCQSL